MCLGEMTCPYYYIHESQREIHVGIFLSMGHSKITELRHYLGIPFSDRDKYEMREWVEGWI